MPDEPIDQADRVLECLRDWLFLAAAVAAWFLVRFRAALNKGRNGAAQSPTVRRED